MSISLYICDFCTSVRNILVKKTVKIIEKENGKIKITLKLLRKKCQSLHFLKVN